MTYDYDVILCGWVACRPSFGSVFRRVFRSFSPPFSPPFSPLFSLLFSILFSARFADFETRGWGSRRGKVKPPTLIRTFREISFGTKFHRNFTLSTLLFRSIDLFSSILLLKFDEKSLKFPIVFSFSSAALWVRAFSEKLRKS